MANKALILINSYLDYAIKAQENSFRSKTFVVYNSSDRIESFHKTKRGAESTIKKSQFSYYDDYTQDMVQAGTGLEVIEVSSWDIVDYFTDKNIWFETMFARWRIGQSNTYLLTQAQEIGCDEDMIEFIQSIIENTNGHSFPSRQMVGLEELKENESVVEVESVQVEQQETELQDESVEQSSITYKLNEEKDGIEIYFDDKPSEEVRTLLKSNGFRWARFNKCWYAKQSDKTIELAKTLSSGNVSETVETSYTDVERLVFDDVAEYTFSEELERRLINNSMINNKEIGYYTKDLQSTFANKIELAKQALTYANNNYEYNQIIQATNDYMKRYYNEYHSYLSQKSHNPSWAVTGRGGMNVSRYNKKQDQMHNKLGKVIAIGEDFESKLNSLKNRFQKSKAKKEQAAVNKAITNNELVVNFKTEQRTIKMHNCTDTRRAYVSNNYFIMKTWGCFRIFDHTGKEVHSMKTAEKLTDAKNYVCYLESKLLNNVAI